MAMIQCSKHGLQQVAETSPYIRNLILTDCQVDREILPVKYYLDFFDKHFWFWSSLDFVKSLGVEYKHESDYILIDNLGEEKSLEISFKLEPVCGLCYAEYIEENNLVFPKEANSGEFF